MTFHKLFATKYFQIITLLAAFLFIQVENATAEYVHSPGSTGVISIDPVLPREGEPFTINIIGQWRDRCIPDQSELTYEVYSSAKSASIRIKTTLDRTNECGSSFEPTNYALSIPIESIVSSYLDISIEISDYPLDHRKMYFQRRFDLVLGLHDIPPRLGSGNWLSEETPYQGLLIQQQGNTVVFHEFTYNRTNGEPNWLYAAGKFHGNSFNGVAYLVNWLSPVAGARSGWRGTPSTLEPYNQLVQPERQDLTFDATSAHIYTAGVNRLVAYLGLHNVKYSNLAVGSNIEEEPQPVKHTYKRWVFALDETELPPVVPDMVGSWNLYGFNGQKLESSYEFKFGVGNKVGDDLYRFFSVEDDWVLNCQINLDGEGDCTLINEDFGLSLTYTLVREPYDLSSKYYFNGNFSIAPLVNSNSAEPDQVGVLLRSGIHLPALDLQ